jgi:peptidoglycan/xylan/chitin deacetylase (PgdA/CDA1 family)
MSKINDKTPVTGWNLFRFYLEGAGSYDADVSTTTIRILVYHSEGTDTDIYVGGITQIKPNKGNLIIIDDGPYYSFYTVAYPALKALGVPVTWAIDPTLLDSENAETRKLINETELDMLAVDGISEFSFHSYNGTIMVNATASEALFDTLNNIRFLKRKGLNPERIFRAAWLNNACADPSLANLELDASASYNGAAGMSVYPFVDKYNIPRYGLGGKTESQIDGIFDKLMKQHCVCLIYLHGISSADRDTDTATWNYFLAKLSDAITAGYLNPTTYNRLVNYYSEV